MTKLEHNLRAWDRRRSERRRLLRSFWGDAKWWVIASLFVLALVLGFIGFREYETAVGGPAGFWDVLYRDFQLFVFESGALDVPSAIPLSLQVARLLAPLVIVVFLNQAFTTVFRDQLQLLRVRRARGHVVVCGLGDGGLRLARSLRSQGFRVVAVEHDEDLDHVEGCRAGGVPVLVGDATDEAILRKAGTGRARCVVAVCGDDRVNAKIAAGARQLATNRAEPLVCYVHIVEPQLCSLLRARQPAGSGAPSFRLEFFNAFESGAQALLLRHRPFPDRDLAGPAPEPHLLVVGLGRLGSGLVVQAARNWSAVHPDRRGGLCVTVVDQDARSEVDSLKLRHPQIEDICSLEPVALDVRSAEFARGYFLDVSGVPVTAVYVCLDDDALSLETALVLHGRLRGRGVPIVMRARTDAGLPALLGARGDDEFDDLRAFPLAERVYDPDLLFGGTDEIIARALHDLYLEGREAEGWRYGPERDDGRKVSPSLAGWDELDEDLRESNRDQAAHTAEKLGAIRCRLEESSGWEEPLSFTDHEIEVLAEMEHERWVRDRIRHGWTLGPAALEPRQSPYLVSWSELAERDDIREFDREFVRELPVILAKIGYRAVRVPP